MWRTVFRRREKWKTDHSCSLLQALFTQDCFKILETFPAFAYIFESIRKKSLPVTHIFHYIHGLICRKQLRILWRTEPWDFILTQCLLKSLSSSLEKFSLLKYSLLNFLCTVTINDLNGSVYVHPVFSKIASLESHLSFLKTECVTNIALFMSSSFLNDYWKCRMEIWKSKE